ncbi:MAG: DUF559 domain-containing protein [Sphingobacteriales bacterium]|nr:MAG: DUF559 domain-containing protein [Sphingobacteriales bacterium]
MSDISVFGIPKSKINPGSGTKSEAIVWKYILKARMMKGYPFKRQRPVLQYIADFLCVELSLIIELDGLSHEHKSVEDELRDAAIEAAGFTILRFLDSDVFENLEGVKQAIENYIEIQESRSFSNSDCKKRLQ